MAFFEERLEEDLEFEKCIRESPGEFKQSSFTMIPNDIHRNIMWERWRGSPRASTVWLLIGYIIRKQMNNPMADKIYNEYYKKRGLLVSRYTQQGLAELLGYADRRAVNKQLKTCEKEGIFDVENMSWGSNNRKIKIYIFGSWENKTGCNYIETFDMFTKFRKEEADRLLEERIIN